LEVGSVKFFVNVPKIPTPNRSIKHLPREYWVSTKTKLANMATTELSESDPIEVPQRARGGSAFVAKAGVYTLLVLSVILGAGVYSIRMHGIFSCQASGYGSDGYLSYCGATNYGDYDHGAIWFDLEPEARTAAANAQVLFLGNSRTVFGFSSKATNEWFSSHSDSYYLLGFSHFENYTFEGPLLQNLHPRAKVYVINIDSFFERSETGPGKTVMRDESAKTRYAEKRRWEGIHKVICTAFSAACGDNEAIFRSRTTGAWTATGRFTSAPVSYDDDVDQKKFANYVAAGNEFLPSLSGDRKCTILTILPAVNTDLRTAQAIASALNRPFVAPAVPGLMTFDGYHLDSESAQRWSAAFFEEAGPQILNCLNG
jgi:hypothetical protein